MLACIQRRQNLSLQNLACIPKSLDVPPPSLLLSVPPLQPCTRKGEPPASMISRYPSPAELDAFAQRTANSPLSIKIFPTDVRVPQHKQLNKTVNGLDTTGQCCSPFSQQYSGGLLATIKASVVVKGVVKTSEGRRTKHANTQTSAGPYNNPLNHGYTDRHGHKAYHISSCKPHDVPIETLCSSTGMASRDQSLAPQSELAEVQSLMRQMSRVPHSQAVQLGGEARASPSLQAVAAVAHSDSDFALGVLPQSSLAFTGAVLPTQSADIAKAGYLEKGDYTMWQHTHQMQQQQQQQRGPPYQQGAGRMYSVSNGAQRHGGVEAGVGQSPETRLPLSYRPHHERVGDSSLNCAAMQGEFSAGQYYAPLWDSVSPNSDGYTSQVLDAGPCAARLRDLGLSHPHLHAGRHQHFQPQLHPPLPPHTQAYSADQNLCCGLPGSSVCHAAVLSSSLQSLECLISEIHPPCIKEHMLGRGYESMGMPQLLEHHQQSHIQLPVYR
ncbi:protein FAM222A [Pseudoliparis swirei]|uniref:protein FAM222A n=1 Tax=Pseudoliparis swirei TaxID=2059687 RepID=UPI0024BD718D|nr:protein FAM222A [Pseudoliparis swirei]XP_056287844.1 protein FAM222A [Pseudoliparis swirei]XP_056287845.1 protein FAM222A [Pseudoliparis swirei]XP_056287846.1 protein FAM222A [Pseudoliparis swirei]XP_056287847.1 protein FAM222A [Pseudoliparis swirei]XP_056287848.1 protein FAM222A [Pseudoliparis swirei]XP_056287849.1 protein FAM222A [Pseudoliparis swirei]